MKDEDEARTKRRKEKEGIWTKPVNNNNGGDPARHMYCACTRVPVHVQCCISKYRGTAETDCLFGSMLGHVGLSVCSM